MGKETLIFHSEAYQSERFYFSFLLIYIALLAIPYIQHKNVSVSYQQKSSQKQSFYSDTAGTERVAYINDNTDALLYRLHMLDEAKDEIILSTFDFNADKSGQDMMASLLHAADRGVSVRILVDGISGFLDVNEIPGFRHLPRTKTYPFAFTIL